MKPSILILASLMTLTSAAAFAEGGAERSKEFYNNFSFIQEKTHGKAEQQVSIRRRHVFQDQHHQSGTTEELINV